MIKIVKENVKVFKCMGCEKTFYNSEYVLFSVFTKREKPTMFLCASCSLNLVNQVKSLLES